MIAPAAITAIACVQAAVGNDEVQTITGVVEAVRNGDFRRAESLVQAETDPLERAQAECYLRHHAGDLAGAEAAARRGLAGAPGDPWLLERATYLALSLRDLSAATAHLERLEDALRESQPEAGGDPEGFRAKASLHRRDLTELSRDLSARDSATQRARAISGVALVLVLGALAFCSRPGR